MALFRLIQASDLHFSSHPDHLNSYDEKGKIGVLKKIFSREIGQVFILSSFSVDQAAALSIDIEKNHRNIDAVVVTGDIATTGFEEDLREARNFFEGSISEEWAAIEHSIPPLVGPANMPPVIIMPGNHDRYTSPIFSPWSSNFEKVFGFYWNWGKNYQGEFPNHKYVRTKYLVKDNSTLVICATDFSLTDKNQASHTTITGFLGEGRVRTRSGSHAEMEPLDELMERSEWIYKNKNILNPSIVWLVHYPPKYPQVDPRLKLINEDQLLAAASRFNIKLILSGHTHKFDDYLADGIRVICCGTTTGTASSSGHQYLELLIDTDKLAETKVIQKRWDPTRGAFF